MVQLSLAYKKKQNINKPSTLRDFDIVIDVTTTSQIRGECIMERFFCVVLFVFFASNIVLSAEYIRFHPKQRPSLPKWPVKYYAEGTLSLPYAELNEPFTIWYDGTSKRSRIDMYGGKSLIHI